MSNHPSFPEDDEEPKKGLVIFGRDISQIPCFRTSLLYGISTGIFAGFASFMKTSRPHYSTNFGLGVFSLTTLAYWFPCRYNYSKQEFEARKIKALIRQQAMYEGTQLEKELDEKAKSA